MKAGKNMLIMEKDITLDLSILNKITEEPSKLLLLDIETTGFSPESNRIYLIGFIRLHNQQFKLTQWLCEKDEDEYELLFRFSRLLCSEYTILHYNGTSFDIPFINKRLKVYNIPSKIHDIKQIDLYLELKPIQRYLNLEDLKLKTVEKAFGFSRLDVNTGGALIKVFLEFTQTRNLELKELLLLHNEEDLLGLYYVLNSYDKIVFFRNAVAKSFSTDDMMLEVVESTLRMRISHKANFNATIHVHPYTLQITLEEVLIIIPICVDTLYYFFPDYKDYFYLPLEDMAVHRSVGQFVDKEHRKKATKSNCYIKKRGTFIPLLKNFNTSLPTYKYTIKDSIHYIELTENLLKDVQLLSQLFSQILSSL